MTTLPKKAPSLINYLKFNILDVPDEIINSSDKYQEWLLKKYQGEAIEFWDNYKIKDSLTAFGIFCRFCPEVIFINFQKEKVLIYSFFKDKIIRSPEISVIKEKTHHYNSVMVEKIGIDLTSFWKKHSKYSFIDKLDKILLEITSLILVRFYISVGVFVG